MVLRMMVQSLLRIIFTQLLAFKLSNSRNVCVGNKRVVYIQGLRKAINLDVLDINSESETRDVVVSIYILSFPSIVYFPSRADTLAHQTGRVMVPRVLLKLRFLVSAKKTIRDAKHWLRGKNQKSPIYSNCSADVYLTRIPTPRTQK